MKQRALVLAIALLALLAAAAYLPVGDWMERLIEWAQANPRTAEAAFVLAFAIGAVCMVPGSLLMLAGGIVFGVAQGLPLAWLGSTLGAACAFLASRFLARGWVESKLRAMPRLRALDSAIGQRGWLIVLLARLSIVIPYNLLNYALGLTRVGFGAYLLSTGVGMLPACVVYLYLGSVTSSLAISGPEASSLPLPLLLGGLLATAALVAVVARITGRALRSELDRSEQLR